MLTVPDELPKNLPSRFTIRVVTALNSDIDYFLNKVDGYIMQELFFTPGLLSL